MRLPIRLSPLLLTAVLTGVLPTSPAPGQAGGPEFRVNTYTTDRQQRPRIATDPGGSFVVVWESRYQDGSYYGVFGQRYSPAGMPLGTEFRVNTYTTIRQAYPSVASDSGGNFVVVWQSRPQDGSTYGVFGQRYGSTGAPLGAEFRVNTYTTDYQARPSVARGSGGNFVVVWASLTQDGSGYGLFGQRYSGTGAPLGTEFRVNAFTTNPQRSHSVASGLGGSFVVVWPTNKNDGSGYSIFGRRYGGAGVPLTAEFRVNTYTTGYTEFPSVASDPGGNFVVVWAGNTQDGSGYGVFGQRYGSAGAPLGGEFRVNTYTTSYQSFPSVTTDSGGNFVVVWESRYQDGSSYGLFGQRFDSGGAPLGTEFRVNTHTTSVQAYPSVSSDSGGNFVVVWDSRYQDGSLTGVFGQRFCAAPLSAVSVSTIGSLSVCKDSTGGTATVTDTGGGFDLHQWYYRTVPSGPYAPISGETGPSYVIKGNDFSNAAPGGYYLFCLTTPTCGSQIFSSDNSIVVTVSIDNTAPAVTPPSALTTTQTLCM